jgi:hypothetical protein
MKKLIIFLLLGLSINSFTQTIYPIVGSFSLSSIADTARAWTGTITFDKSIILFKCTNDTLKTNQAISFVANPLAGSYAEVKMIGDGSHSPTFATGMYDVSGNTYDTTLGTVNKLLFHVSNSGEVEYSIRQRQ